jgi:cytochrome b subunit of formate dehydrogenase
MTAARFLYISGACFLLAAAFRYFGKEQAALSTYVPALVFLICGVIALIHRFWVTYWQKKP